MKRRSVLALWFSATAAILGGCETYSVDSLGGGLYRVTYSEPLAQPHSAASIVNWRFTECPHGYETVRQSVEILSDGTKTYVFILRCHNAGRP